MKPGGIIAIKVDGRYAPDTVKNDSGVIRISREAMATMQPALELGVGLTPELMEEYMRLQMDPPVIVRGTFAKKLKGMYLS